MGVKSLYSLNKIQALHVHSTCKPQSIVKEDEWIFLKIVFWNFLALLDCVAVKTDRKLRRKNRKCI